MTYAPQQVLDGAEWNDAGASRVSALCNLGKGEQVKFITGPKKKKPNKKNHNSMFMETGFMETVAMHGDRIQKTGKRKISFGFWCGGLLAFPP